MIDNSTYFNVLTVQNHDLLNIQPTLQFDICEWARNLPLTEGDHSQASHDIQLSLTPEDARFETPSPRDLESVMPDMCFSTSFFQVSASSTIQKLLSVIAPTIDQQNKQISQSLVSLLSFHVTPYLAY